MPKSNLLDILFDIRFFSDKRQLYNFPFQKF